MNDLNKERGPAALARGHTSRLAVAKPRNLTTGGTCQRCGADEVRAILNRSEAVCGHCIDSMAQLAAVSQAVVRAVALDMTPSIECMA